MEDDNFSGTLRDYQTTYAPSLPHWICLLAGCVSRGREIKAVVPQYNGEGINQLHASISWKPFPDFPVKKV